MSARTPFDTVMQASTAFWLSRCVHVVADLAVADAVGDDPKPVDQIAKAVGVDASSLARILRLLSSHGIFEARDGTYIHNDASRLLRSDAPSSLRAFAQMIGSPLCWASFAKLDFAVKTGKPATGEISPGGLFAYFEAHPDEARVFDAAMSGKSHGQVEAILGAYDFSAYASVADIGGGAGHLLVALTQKVPSIKATLFDLPHVIDRAAPIASDRLALRAGDFFADELPTADLYILMEVLHDWPEAECVAILEAVRKAAPSRAKLLVMENLVPSNDAPHWAKALDVNMLCITGGRERTLAEYEALFAKAGFEVSRAIEMPPISILEVSIR